MGYKQEPCPLCGRDMTAIETYPGRGELYCGYCDLTIGGNNAKTPEEIIALMDSSEHRWLQAENAKLREELDAVGMAAYLYGKEQLESENAKLRELIRELYECSRQTGCDSCGYADGCGIERDMHELGVVE